MQSVKPPDRNIQFLITANYQRMVSFEQAAFLTNEPSFKEFYLERAAESEINIKQLYLVLDMKNPGDEQIAAFGNIMPDTCFPNIFQGKKNTIRMLESVKMIEKTIANWYKNTLKEITGLPSELVELIKEQYRVLNDARVQLEYL